MKWIAVKDALPEKPGVVLVFAQSLNPKIPFRSVAWYDTGQFWNIPEPWAKAISHWMPFPPNPKRTK